MEYLAIGTTATAAILLITTVYFALRYKHSKKLPAPTVEAQDMLADMLSGGAVIKVEVIDASKLLLHRG